MHLFLPQSFVECLLLVRHFARLCVYSNERLTVALASGSAGKQAGRFNPSDKLMSEVFADSEGCTYPGLKRWGKIQVQPCSNPVPTELSLFCQVRGKMECPHLYV